MMVDVYPKHSMYGIFTFYTLNYPVLWANRPYIKCLGIENGPGGICRSRFFFFVRHQSGEPGTCLKA